MLAIEPHNMQNQDSNYHHLAENSYMYQDSKKCMHADGVTVLFVCLGADVQ